MNFLCSQDPRSPFVVTPDMRRRDISFLEETKKHYTRLNPEPEPLYYDLRPDPLSVDPCRPDPWRVEAKSEADAAVVDAANRALSAISPATDRAVEQYDSGESKKVIIYTTYFFVVMSFARWWP